MGLKYGYLNYFIFYFLVVGREFLQSVFKHRRKDVACAEGRRLSVRVVLFLYIDGF